MADPAILPVPPRVKDLTGTLFGRLAVTSFAGLIPNAVGKRYAYFNCRCSCGVDVVVRGTALSSGNTLSCGCLARESGARTLATYRASGGEPAQTHGRRYTPEHAVWRGMKQRCYNPNDHAYANYGGRGIVMCDEWRDSFMAFFADMGERPSGMSLDRIDVNGPYTLSNCRWATAKEQALNMRKSLKVEYQGKIMSVQEAATLSGVPYQRLVHRMGIGVPSELLFSARYEPRGRMR